ncbi:MAG: peptide-methionine (S)-S-oxide reductase MsrA [Methanobacteriota archaeon]|nr:MAG: peptide-methionine (S)-S-oxide reductase MsrA [Euryarchaeota archaeon]
MTETATFAAGCFWKVEAAFQSVPGIVWTEVGYSGGHVANPSYEAVCAGHTGHAESVRVVFDSEALSYEQLLEVFWSIHDPCSANRQGPDVGSQYRSIIFYHSDEQRLKANAARQELERGDRCGGANVATEITPASAFFRAEEYHQRYYEKHGMAFRRSSPGCTGKDVREFS